MEGKSSSNILSCVDLWARNDARAAGHGFHAFLTHK